ncbi:zinc finger protein 660-like [Anopheles aquasalis]|uniref:zinc finger protein 660-like n=1 Tax=Anopheles aquasalis TaxID=42839 RepID=UPI00215B3290|nr:zinc finger protein 660-like [Anopheles aquasalis]XP_050091516.1 zinc finger protein 660-like [Anopheles aquasalis]
MEPFLVLYVPYATESTPAMQISSLECTTVAIGERDIQHTPHTRRIPLWKQTTFDRNNEIDSVLMDDLLAFGPSDMRVCDILSDAKINVNCKSLPNETYSVYDCHLKPSKFAPISKHNTIEESFSSIDEGFGQSNSEDSADDQTTVQIPLITSSPKISIIPKKGQSKSRSYDCEICHQRFPLKKSLRNHQANEHPGENCNKCTICLKTFKLRSNLRQHLRIHTGERPFQCEVCNKTFVQGSALTVHRELHKDQRDYECKTCQKAFKSKFAFKKHEKVHTGQRPFKCEVCGKTFTQSCNLKAHQKLHSGKHAYECVVCSKTFRFNSHYQDHKMTHTKDKKYCCNDCGRTFAYKNSYQRHILIHRDAIQYHCSVCGKLFGKLSHLNFHIKSHGSNHMDSMAIGNSSLSRLSCNISEIGIDTNQNPRDDLREVNGVNEREHYRYKCVICTQSFEEEKELQTHFKLHEADDCPFQCGMCGILNLNHFEEVSPPEL